MAVRVRANGNIFCAAHSEPQDGDIYIDDALHYQLSEIGLLLTDNNHFEHWQWWWYGKENINGD